MVIHYEFWKYNMELGESILSNLLSEMRRQFGRGMVPKEMGYS